MSFPLVEIFDRNFRTARRSECDDDHVETALEGRHLHLFVLVHRPRKYFFVVLLGVLLVGGRPAGGNDAATLGRRRRFGIG